MLDHHCAFFSIFFFGYLLGSVPFGLILINVSGYGDIRDYGSRNIGATNVFRRSRILGILTLILDMGKGAFAVYASTKLCSDYMVAIFAGVASVLGHIFPVWLQFRGGKGVATGIAVITMLHWPIGALNALIWIIVFMIVKISGAAAIASFAATPVLTYIITHDTRLVMANSFICTIVIIKHWQNIKKIIKELQ